MQRDEYKRLKWLLEDAMRPLRESEAPRWALLGATMTSEVLLHTERQRDLPFTVKRLLEGRTPPNERGLALLASQPIADHQIRLSSSFSRTPCRRLGRSAVTTPHFIASLCLVAFFKRTAGEIEGAAARRSGCVRC
jgi:hypothetical protein